MTSHRLSALFVAILFCCAASSPAGEITLAFQANSVGEDPLFTITESFVAAQNTLDLTVDVNGNTTTFAGAQFVFNADVVGFIEVPEGAILGLANIQFSFSSAGGLIVEAADAAAVMFFPRESTVAGLSDSTNLGDLYTIGPELAAYIDSLGMASMPLGQRQDYSFAMADVVLIGIGEGGFELSATASFVGGIVPGPGAFAAGAALLAALARRRMRPMA